MTDIIRVRTHQSGGWNVVHQIEIAPWHVKGYVNGRCLTHGHEQPHTDKEDKTKLAVTIAQACCRERSLPFHQDRELQPLAPPPDDTGRNPGTAAEAGKEPQ